MADKLSPNVFSSEHCSSLLAWSHPHAWHRPLLFNASAQPLECTCAVLAGDDQGAPAVNGVHRGCGIRTWGVAREPRGRESLAGEHTEREQCLSARPEPQPEHADQEPWRGAKARTEVRAQGCMPENCKVFWGRTGYLLSDRPKLSVLCRTMPHGCGISREVP